MTNISHFIRLAITSLVLFAGNAIAQTHCNEAQGEVTHFSCQVSGSNRVASLCGGYANPEWVQYRFGKIGKIELAYPASAEKSLNKFEGTYFNKYSYVSYLFINDKALYEIELSESYPKISGVINVEVDKKKRQFRCSKAISRDYWDSLIDLSARTFKHTGEGRDSFLYQYHNFIAK